MAPRWLSVQAQVGLHPSPVRVPWPGAPDVRTPGLCLGLKPGERRVLDRRPGRGALDV